MPGGEALPLFAFRTTSQEVRFLARPLGLDFSRSIPMHVKAVKQDYVVGLRMLCGLWKALSVESSSASSSLSEVMSHESQVQTLPNHPDQWCHLKKCFSILLYLDMLIYIYIYIELVFVRVCSSW